MAKKLLKSSPDLSYVRIGEMVADAHGGPPMSSSTIATLKREIGMSMLRPRYYTKKAQKIEDEIRASAALRSLKDKNKKLRQGERIEKEEQVADPNKVISDLNAIQTEEQINSAESLNTAVNLLKEQLDAEGVGKFWAVKDDSSGKWEIKAIKETVIRKKSLMQF